MGREHIGDVGGQCDAVDEVMKTTMSPSGAPVATRAVLAMNPQSVGRSSVLLGECVRRLAQGARNQGFAVGVSRPRQIHRDVVAGTGAFSTLWGRLRVKQTASLRPCDVDGVVFDLADVIELTRRMNPPCNV